jgi:hypothetical protein
MRKSGASEHDQSSVYDDSIIARNIQTDVQFSGYAQKNHSPGWTGSWLAL